MIRLILNGKKAALPEIRDAITSLRSEGHTVEVRVTWEYGDVHRFIKEAIEEKVPRVVAGGGDGTINEVVDALLQKKGVDLPEVAVLPLGTANDFARACQIPLTIRESLQLALKGNSILIDVGKANEKYFVNVATGGFGAQVTAETPPQLKNFLGGGAYTLTGIAKALNFSPISGKMKCAEHEGEFELIAGAICNGRQAGGGQQLAPLAFINDGLLDVVIISTFPAFDIDVVISELLTPESNGKYVTRLKTEWLETISNSNSDQVNLDGEPYSSKKIRFEVVPDTIKLVLPEGCPCIL